MAAQILKREDGNAFVWRGIHNRVWRSRWSKDEKYRHAENQKSCGCQSEARASRVACFWGATLQARCQFACARPRGRFKREHRFKQRFQAIRNVRCFELFDGKYIRFLRAVDLFQVTACKRYLSGKRKPERFAQRINVG